MIKTLAIGLIKLYQKTLSPKQGWLVSNYRLSVRGCRFYPSCSEYSIKAIEKYGLVKGTFRSVIRILRCNPWSRGGVDRP